ncbi:MAG TPA: O-antigen ligase family protein [Holophaga sp.]|nr:O-antigen ligase family protein [Holophaga sp.]
MRAGHLLATALAWTMVGLFCTDFVLYGFTLKFLPPPVVFFAGFAAGVALLAALRPGTGRAFLESRFVLWLAIFLAVTLAWYFMTPQDEEYQAFLRLRLYTLGLLGSALVLLSIPEARAAARKALAAAVILGVALNLVDLFAPLTFSPFLGRSAGLYLNPNVSGISLLMGAIAAWEAVPTRARIWFYGITLVGIIPTFSRSAILLGLLLGPTLCWMGQLRWRAWAGALAAVAGTALGTGALLLGTGWIPVDSSIMTDLILRVSLSTDDYSTADRLQVLDEALAMIARSPWIGHGTGASYLWTLDRSSHNAYLNLMADHGVWAAALIPGLFGSLARRSTLCVVAICCWSIVGFFSHNLLDETSWIALLAFLPYLGEPDSSSKKA